LKRAVKNYFFLFLLVSVIVILDQISKTAVRNNLRINEIWSPWPWLTPYARIVHLSNTGVAFGMFQGLGGIFTILAIIVSAAIIYYYPRVPAQDWTLRLALGLQLSGAVGNLIDRITQGFVTDFISIGNFAVFNVADSCITVGVGILVLGVWLQERRKKKMETAQVLEPDLSEPDRKDGTDA